jgi:tetratricopeptide (TPR) repeat protein
MLLGLPVVAATAYVHHTTRRIATRTPVLTPNGSGPAHGTMATLALKASPHLTWKRTWRGGMLALGGFTAVVVAIFVLRLFGIGPAASLLAAGKLEGRPRLLVVDFTASDTGVSHVITEAVRTSLDQSKAVSIMPPAAIAAALRRMQLPATTRIDVPRARDIAQREGAKAIVTGSATQLGAGFAITLRLVAADSGNDLAAFQETVNSPSELLAGIDKLTRKLRGRIGESLKEVRDAPALDQVTTNSLDALKKYADANRAIDFEGDYMKAVALLRDAVAKDTTFAMAYRKLGVTLSNIGMPREQADSALERGYQFRDRLPDKEKYLLVGTYYQTGPGRDRRKAIEAFEQVLAIDSTDPAAANNLANLLRGRREFARAESLYAMIANKPGASQTAVSNYAGILMNSGKLAPAESVFREMLKRFPNVLAAQVGPAAFMEIRGQHDSVEQFYKGRVNSTNPIAKINALSNLSQVTLLRGRLRDARSYGAQAQAANAARGVPANPLADSLTSAAIAIWYLERPEQGVKALDGVQLAGMRNLPIDIRLNIYSTLATFYALAGRPDKARAMLAQFDAEAKTVNYRALLEPARNSMLGEIALAENKPLDAIRLLWKADSLPDGPASSCRWCLASEIGRAYDLANMPDSAIANWERFLGDPVSRTSSGASTYLPGIHKRLGELYEEKGDVQKAASHYIAFIDLWKNADAELQPKVQDARKRLDRLKGVAGR